MPKKKKEIKPSESTDKETRLSKALAEIEKLFGKGSIMTLDGSYKANVESIPTGSLSLDWALGIGGIPKGRIVEVYGPESSGKTTLSLSLIKEVQSKGGVAAFIDAEHAFDSQYAKMIGVNIEKLLISQPGTGEEALEIAEKLTSSESVDLIVIDSVAALTPRAEIEGTMGQSHMGLQARLMSQALRKLTGIASKTNTTIVFINQIRMKIGVLFGCFHYNARVTLENGKTGKIGKIVNQKKNLNVLSYNTKTNKLEYKPIINHFKNGKAKKFYQMVIKYPHKGGKSSIPIGDNHIFPTTNGLKEFKKLNKKDNLYIRSYKYLNSEQKEIALGMILGDSSLKTSNNLTVSLRTKHSYIQNSYCKWKKSLFSKEFIGCEGIDNKNRYWFDSSRTTELYKFKKNKYKKALRKVDNDIIKNLSLKGIAIWYLDDGNFSGSYKYWGKGKSRIYCTKLSLKNKRKIVSKFKQLRLLNCKIDKKGFIFYGKNSYNFQKKIVKYIPKCMSYKIHPKLRKLCETYKYNRQSLVKDVIIPSKILKIYNKPNTRSKFKYDLEIKDNHNYFIDNVLVHNSPETTTGGNALKFYASVRIDLRRIASLKKGDDFIGNKIRATVKKSKVSAPFKRAEFDIYFNEGISEITDILNLAIKHGVVKQSGAWLSFNDENIGQGIEKAKENLKNTKLIKTIEKQVCNILGIKK